MGCGGYQDLSRVRCLLDSKQWFTVEQSSVGDLGGCQYGTIIMKVGTESRLRVGPNSAGVFEKISQGLSRS